MASTGRSESASPAALTALGVFLAFGSLMALLGGFTLTWPGTVLDRFWALNPRAYVEMAPLGRWFGLPFLFLSVVLAAAALGWLKRSYWGWLLAVLVIATQVLGDTVNLLRGNYLQGATGVAIAGLLLGYLLSRKVRQAFKSG
jgi:hypothetical protein